MKIRENVVPAKQDCVWYHDCCLGHLFNDNPKPPLEYLKMFYKNFNVTSKIERTKYQEEVSKIQSVCTPILKNLPNSYNSLKIMMVTRCFNRGISSKKIQKKCENVNEEDYRHFVPVAVIGVLIFRNRYCALCNGFETYLPYEIIYQGCVNTVTMPFGFKNHSDAQETSRRLHNFLSKSLNCTVSIRGKMEWHNEMIRACSFEQEAAFFSNKSSHCNQTEQKLCNSFAAFARSNASSQLFHNPFCAKCALVSPYNIRFDQCNYDFQKFLPDYRNEYFTPLSVLISFRKKTLVRLVEEDALEKRKVYDSIQCTQFEYFSIKREECAENANLLKGVSLNENNTATDVTDDYVLKKNCTGSRCLQKESTIAKEANKSCNNCFTQFFVTNEASLILKIGNKRLSMQMILAILMYVFL